MKKEDKIVENLVYSAKVFGIGIIILFLIKFIIVGLILFLPS